MAKDRLIGRGTQGTQNGSRMVTTGDGTLVGRTPVRLRASVRLRALYSSTHPFEDSLDEAFG